MRFCWANGLLLLVVAVLSIASMLSSCGKTGDLYLPNEFTHDQSGQDHSGQDQSSQGQTQEQLNQDQANQDQARQDQPRQDQPVKTNLK